MSSHHGGHDVEPEAQRPQPCRCPNPMFLLDARLLLRSGAASPAATARRPRLPSRARRGVQKPPKLSNEAQAPARVGDCKNSLSCAMASGIRDHRWSMLRKRRQRRALEDAIYVHVFEADERIDEIAEAMREQLATQRKRLAALPGSNPLCGKCGARMKMRPVKEGRRWYKLWTCRACGIRATLSDIPRGRVIDGP